MEIQFILTVIFVRFGLTVDDGVHSNNQITNKKEPYIHDEVSTGIGVQLEFFNLLDSIVKSDKKKAETYRNVLKQESGSEQQSFNLMKEKLRFARRPRNAHEQEYFRKKAAMSKRQTGSRDFRRALFGVTDYHYIHMYGNDVNTSGIWQRARDLASDADKLKNISYEAHMAAVWPVRTGGIEIDKAYVTNEILMFSGTNFTDIRADMIAYQLVGLPKVTFYLTKGLRPGCLIYVWKIKKAGPKWELKNEVCDISLL